MKKIKESKMFKVGDKIVYPMQGVGEITAIENKNILGKRRKYYLLTIANPGMNVMIPVEKSEEIGVRKIISKKNVTKVLETLSKGKTKVEEDWKQRYQNNIDKVKSGSIYEVAEVTRDLYKRGRIKELSIMERKLYEKAYQLVTNEIAFSKKIDLEEAGDFVSEALSVFDKEIEKILKKNAS